VDAIVNSGAVIYGCVLMLAGLVRHPLTEAMRIDSLFMKGADEDTRPVNLVAGLLIAAYGGWSLLAA